MSKTIYTNGKIIGDIGVMVLFGDRQAEYQLETLVVEEGYVLKPAVIRSIAPEGAYATRYDIGESLEDSVYASLTIHNSLSATVKIITGQSTFCRPEELIGKEVQAFYQENKLCGFRGLPSER